MQAEQAAQAAEDGQGHAPVHPDEHIGVGGFGRHADDEVACQHDGEEEDEEQVFEHGFRPWSVPLKWI